MSGNLGDVTSRDFTRLRSRFFLQSKQCSYTRFNRNAISLKGFVWRWKEFNTSFQYFSPLSETREAQRSSKASQNIHFNEVGACMLSWHPVFIDFQGRIRKNLSPLYSPSRLSIPISLFRLYEMQINNPNENFIDAWDVYRVENVKEFVRQNEDVLRENRVRLFNFYSSLCSLYHISSCDTLRSRCMREIMRKIEWDLRGRKGI